MTAPRPLSIAFVTVADLPEGWGRTGRLRTLVGALTGMGHKVQIWNEHSLESSGIEKPSGTLCGGTYEYVLGTVERKKGFGSISLKLKAVREILSRIRNAVRNGGLDLIIFNHLAFYDIYPITRLAQRLGIPTVQCYEDERMELVLKHNISLSQKIFGLNSWAADHWCSGMADQLWVISSYLRDKYAKLSRHPERVHIVPTIIDCEEWSMPEESPASPPLILYSGGFGEHEDIEKIAQSLGFLKQWGVPFRMLFLGANPQLRRVQELQKSLQALQIQELVELRGFSPTAVVKQCIAQANVLMNLRTNSTWSRSGLSTKLSEYLASGRTVFTTDIGDNARYVENGRSAVVVSPDAPAEQVARSLQEVLQDPKLRHRLGKGAREAALEHFHVGRIQEQLNGLLLKMVRKDSNRG